MLMENTHKFINGEEAVRFFADQAGVDLSKFKVPTKLKAWVGAYYGVFKYEPSKVNPVIIDKVRLVNLEARRQGSFGLLISSVTGKVVELSCHPTPLYKGGFAVGFPQRTYFERTIQEFGEGEYAFGLSACLQVYHQQRPDWASENIPFMDLWGNVRQLFTTTDAFMREISTLQSKVNLL